MHQILQIVPQLPPAINGLGDYGSNLAKQLYQDFGIKTHFLVGDPNWVGAKHIEEFSISQVAEHSATELVSMLSNYSATVLLHYVGYGYAKRGCPVWLIEGLEYWKRNISNSHLVTMFHEIYASGPPWTSAFWLSEQQKELAARLVKLSDRCMTSKQLYSQILHQLSQREQPAIFWLPVFSNVGEPQQLLPLVERQKQLVVFGGYSNRLRVYKESLKELTHVCQVLEIEQIVDIGLSVNLALSSLAGVPIKQMGQLSPIEITNILSNSLAGFFNYPTHFLAKSGVFAAYCAHGLLPVSAHFGTLVADGIKPGQHYWFPEEPRRGLKSMKDAQAIANNAYAWYQTHNLSVHAKTFAAFLTNPINTEFEQV